MAEDVDRGEEEAARRFLSHPAVSSLLLRAQAAAGDRTSAASWVLWRLSLARPEDADARVALREAFWDAGLRDWLRANGHEDAARTRSVPDEVLARWADELRGGM
jgi:hypothetical protein